MNIITRPTHGHLVRLTLTLTAGLLLAACGGSGSDRSNQTETLGGVAAVGAPLAGATVELRCTGIDTTATTDAQGIWTVEVPAGATPCLIKASGGTPPATLYSYAAESGTVNITPLTTLAVARTAGTSDLGAWFDTASAAPLAAAVATASNDLVDALDAAGYTVPANFDPFSGAFDAQAGDPHDDLLEALADTLAREDQSLDDFIAQYVDEQENPFPPATPPGPVETYTIGGTVSGLTGTVVLQNNAGDNLSLDSNGGFTFAAAVNAGSSYSVAVLTQPSNQTCSISNGSGAANANVTNINVVCQTNPPIPYTIGGSIGGLNGTVILQNNGGGNLSRSDNGAFTFASPINAGSTYSVTVLTQPSGQTCTVTNGSGTANANVTNVNITCTNNAPVTYTIGGNISGLNGTVVLQNSSGGSLSRNVDGAFTFTSSINAGSTYSVSVLTQPSEQTCTVTNGSGTANANVTNVNVTCTDNPPLTYTIGGSISGATGTVSWETLALGGIYHDGSHGNGPVTFTYGTGLEEGTQYSVIVTYPPEGQTCTVTNGAGTLTADVGNVAINCVDEETDADTTPPVLTVPAPLVFDVNATGSISRNHADVTAFFAGATAIDNVDGDISGNITTDPTQAALPSTFSNLRTITFSVTDAAGNTTTAESTIEVRRHYQVMGNISGASEDIAWKLWVDDTLHNSGTSGNGAVTYTTGIGARGAWRLEYAVPEGQYCTGGNPRTGNLINNHAANVNIACNNLAQPGGLLGDKTGFTALVDGVRYTTFNVDYVGPPLSVGAAYLSPWSTNDAFYANAGSFVGQEGVERPCGQHGAPSWGIPGFDITLNGVSYSGNADADGNGGHCLLTTTELTDDRVRVSVSGTFWRSGDDGTAPQSVEVTDGEFQFVLERFPPGNGQAQVSASFEGLNAGSYDNNSPAPVTAGDVGWKKDWVNLTVADVSANPLVVTPAGGDELQGGDRAAAWLGGEYSFSKVFDNDEVYASFLIRHESGFSPSRVLTFANPAVYVGLNGFDGSGNLVFQASIGDDASEKVAVPGITLETGATYHVAGRLYKADGADHYNRLDIWVDPARDAQANPLATAARGPSSGTGNVRFVDKTNLRNVTGGSNVVHIDRIRFSDTWEGLFEDEPASGGGDVEDPEGDLQLLIDYAGTYTAACTAVEPASRGTATRDHARGTITIAADGAVDFDTGISFTAAQVNQLFDRTFIEGDARRIHVNYDADDSGRRLEIYLDASLQVTEIRYSDGQGGLTRAAIGSDGNCDQGPPPPQDDPELGASNGASARLDGVRGTHTNTVSSTAGVTAARSEIRFTVTDSIAAGQRGWFIEAQLVEGPQQCNGTSVVLRRYVAPSTSSVMADSCTIELTAFPAPGGYIPNAPVSGTFNGIVTIGGTSVVVTEGVFQYTP